MATSTAKFSQSSSHATSLSENVRFWNRFTLGRIFAGTFCIATLLVFGISWVSIFIFELAAVYIVSEVLVCHMPSQIENWLRLNCIRMDGSWSHRRQRHESRAVNKLRWDIRVILLLVMIPTTLLIWLFDREVAPISIGFSAVSEVAVSNEKWKAGLKNEEHQFDLWSERSHGNFDTAEHKRLLWDAWPFIVAIGFAWLVSCWFVIKQMFIYQLKDLVSGIEDRKWQYMLADRSRAEEWRD